jgi:outer membrane lipoprotein-sorting protein
MKLIAALGLACIAFGQTPEGKPAEEVYKNITALKGTPADQIGPSMQVISSALGVECEFCHVQGKPEADDKGAKRTAREMIAMTEMINKNAFRGQRQITCYSCHRGAVRPVSVAPVLESDAAPARPAMPTAPPAGGGGQQVTADQIAEKYLTAAGGADAIQKVTSRVMKGTITAQGSQNPIDVITKAPNMRVTISHTANGDSFTAFDGKGGWMGMSGRPARDMSPLDAAGAALDAEFALPLHLKEVFPQLRRGRPETINGMECDVLNASGPGHPVTRLYFDRKSGLLVRMVRYTDTPVGRNPVQIDYADFKAVDGVTIPMRWTLSRTSGRFTIQIAEVKSNAAVDDSKFAKPQQ